MRASRSVTKEHKKACEAMEKLIQKGGGHTPSAGDSEVYLRLATVKNTLEWVHPRLIRTRSKGNDRYNALMGYNHYVNGPTHVVLYP